MKKNYLLLLVFLLLGAGTAYFLFSKDDKAAKNTLGWDRKFAVENEAEIHKIFIAKRTGVTTTLLRNGDHWTYNDQWKANPTAMRSLLEAITNVNLKYVPPKAALNNIVQEIATEGVKVEIYNKKDELLKSYYVGGIGSDGESTHMIMDGSEQPMSVAIPQMVGHIRPRFDMIGDQWRDKAVFSYKPEDIQSVTVEYPAQRNKSFKLKRDGNGFVVTPFYDNVTAVDRPVQKGRVEGFLTGFERLVAESFANNYPHKDSVRNNLPFTVISVTDVEGNEKIAALYQTYKVNTYTGERSGDIIERYHADMGTGDWMLVQHRVFEKIFWPYEAFFEVPGRAVKD